MDNQLAEETTSIESTASTKIGYSVLVNESTDDASSESSGQEETIPFESTASTKIGYSVLVNESSDDASSQNLGSQTNQDDDDYPESSRPQINVISLWSQGYIYGAGHGKLL